MTDLVERLRACADDPMWTSHAEVPKAICRKAASEIERLRAALAQRGEVVPQEPIGEVVIGEDGFTKGWTVVKWRADVPPIAAGTKLYATPQQRKPLTFTEVCELMPPDFQWGDKCTPALVRHVLEAAHGIKNEKP